MTKRASLRANLPAAAREEVAEATAVAAELSARRQTAPAAEAKRSMTTSTIHLPVDLLDALRAAALRRASQKARADDRGRGGRPSVSEIVVELLERHRDELASLD